MERIEVLLVEDNESDALLITMALKDSKEYFKVEHVTTAKATIRRIDNDCPNVILLDLGLPDSNGLETLDRIIEACPLTPVVILSGLDNEDFIIEAANHGASEYIIKDQNSLTSANLRKVIHYVISNRENTLMNGIENDLKKGLNKIIELKVMNKKLSETLKNGSINGSSKFS